MPSVITSIDAPPQRKFFNLASSDNHARHFMSDGFSRREHNNTNSFYEKPTLDNPTVSSTRFRLSLSENSKFLICCFMWYISSSLSSNTGKHIMNMFKFPVTLTFVQFFFVACWCAIMENIFKSTGIKKPTKIIAQTIIPLSSFMIVGHVFSSISISRIPVSLVHTIKVRFVYIKKGEVC